MNPKFSKRALLTGLLRSIKIAFSIGSTQPVLNHLVKNIKEIEAEIARLKKELKKQKH